MSDGLSATASSLTAAQDMHADAAPLVGHPNAARPHPGPSARGRPAPKISILSPPSTPSHPCCSWSAGARIVVPGLTARHPPVDLSPAHP
ncbi:hypothetical protein FA95DRAFT_1614089 [Auriscalpium vulgare]|uniref:Uncharacterized protein n=1 Tax=Auriscalpium vulgare TaxID=40419 RepID=A0ACB8R1Z4_9AGAM|nr:hypothetical protein FA95DRAFT_1614089 [Auriscalpium vulgare]